MNEDEERAARRARILARGAERLALVKGEIASLPPQRPPSPPQQAPPAVDLTSEADNRSVDAVLGAPDGGDALPVGTVAVSEVPLVSESAVLTLAKTAKIAEAVTIARATVTDGTTDKTPSVLRQRRAVAVDAPAPTISSLTSTPAAQSRTPPSSPQLATRSASTGTEASLVVTARRERRAKCIAAVQNATPRVLSLLLGCALAMSRWSCGYDAVGDVRDREWWQSSEAASPRLSLLRRKLSDFNDGGRMGGETIAPLDAVVSTPVPSREAPDWFWQPQFIEDLVCGRPLTIASPEWDRSSLPLITGILITVRLTVALLPGLVGYATGGTLFRGDAGRSAPQQRQWLGFVLQHAPSLLLAAGALRSVLHDALMAVFGFVVASTILSYALRHNEG